MSYNRIFLIIGIFLLVLSIVGGVMWWWPKFNVYNGLKAELGSIDSQLKQKQKYFADLSDIKDKMDGYKDQLARMDAALPDDVDLAVLNLHNFFEEKVSQSGVKLTGMTGGDSTTITSGTSGMKEYPFSLNVSGTYQTFKNFLMSLYNNVRIFTVEGIRIVPGTAENKDQNQVSGLFSFEIKLKTYMSSPVPVETGKTPEPGSVMPVMPN